jgi:hypothetical protein
MSKVIASILVLISLVAQADHQPVLESEEASITNIGKLNCVVPIQDAAPVVSLEVALANDTSVDFVTLTLTSPTSKEILFMQLEKGALETQMAAGAVSMMVIQEGFGQENGVIKKAGLLNLQKDEAGNFGGILLAMGNIYPLACEVVK